MTTDTPDPHIALYLATVRRDAKALLRSAVELDVTHRKSIYESTRFSDCRDDIVADLLAAGCPANYADYNHPSEV